MRHDTDVQHSRMAAAYERVWSLVNETDENTEDSADAVRARLTLDILEDDFRFLKQWALFLNERSREKLKGLNKKKNSVSRKSLGERSLHAQLIAQHDRLKPMFDEVGPFPPVSSHKVLPDERKAMQAYVKQYIAWEKKRSKK